MTCAAGTYLPANSETCATCSQFYYCPGGTFDLSDSAQGRNPCPAVATHTPESFSVNGFPVTQVGGGDTYMTTGKKTITQCTVSYQLKSSTVGRLFRHANYNTTTEKYDNFYATLWFEVNSGYYLYDKRSCGTYAYYSNAAICPEGYYCPGKTGVVCNSSNSAEVWTPTFGREACPANKPHSPIGSTSINDCYGDPPKIVTTSYVQGFYDEINTTKQDRLESGVNVITTGAPDGMVVSVTADHGIVHVHKEEIQIPVGSVENPTSWLPIWVE